VRVEVSAAAERALEKRAEVVSAILAELKASPEKGRSQ
jgi:hypothetical protein